MSYTAHQKSGNQKRAEKRKRDLLDAASDFKQKKLSDFCANVSQSASSSCGVRSSETEFAVLNFEPGSSSTSSRFDCVLSRGETEISELNPVQAVKNHDEKSSETGQNWS